MSRGEHDPLDLRARTDRRRREEAAAAYTPPLKERILSLAQMRGLPKNEPLIAGLLDRDSTVFLVGAPGTYKSIIEQGIVSCVATGKRWHGNRQVTRGPVLVFYGEGAAGYADRQDAWNEVNNWHTDPENVRIHPGAINLHSKKDVDEIVELADVVQPALICFDTYARMTPGADENSATDAGISVAALDRIRTACGACMFVVHHTGKSVSAGMRGSSALLGAADTVIEVSASDQTVTLKPVKQKHHPTGNRIQLRVKAAAGSVALVSMAGADTIDDELSGARLDALRVLHSIRAPEGVTITSWVQAAGEVAGISESTVKRARTDAAEMGFIEPDPSSSKHSSRWHLTDQGRDLLVNPPETP